MIILVLFVFIHLNIFAQKADCAPDTHVHIYVPPEQEGGQVEKEIHCHGIFSIQSKFEDKDMKAKRL